MWCSKSLSLPSATCFAEPCGGVLHVDTPVNDVVLKTSMIVQHIQYISEFVHVGLAIADVFAEGASGLAQYGIGPTANYPWMLQCLCSRVPVMHVAVSHMRGKRLSQNGDDEREIAYLSAGSTTKRFLIRSFANSLTLAQYSSSNSKSA